MPDPIGTIAHYGQAMIPEFRFEWHPGAGIVYAIPTEPPIPQADPIAKKVHTDDLAKAFVLIWCQGYLAHKQGLAFPHLIQEKSDGQESIRA